MGLLSCGSFVAFDSSPILLEGVKFQSECIIKRTYDGIPLGCSFVVIITFFERFYARDTLFFKML